MEDLSSPQPISSTFTLAFNHPSNIYIYPGMEKSWENPCRHDKTTQTGSTPPNLQPGSPLAPHARCRGKWVTQGVKACKADLLFSACCPPYFLFLPGSLPVNMSLSLSIFTLQLLQLGLLLLPAPPWDPEIYQAIEGASCSRQISLLGTAERSVGVGKENG